MLVAQTAISQRTYDIRFVLDTLDCEANTVCYRTELRSADGQGWNLAGQNYRIFYDGSMAEYIDESALSLLPESQYFLDLTQIQDAQHVPAGDFGYDLPFADDLSFLNYSVDLMNLSSGGVVLESSGEWVATSKLCFDVPAEATTDPNLCLELVWARMGRTDDYATAFVEVSQWVQTNSTTDALTNIYDDLDSQDSEGACLAFVCSAIPLETTLEACTDGIDNDGDGLVDCQDDLCAPFCPSDATLYDISLDLASVECSTGTACYSVKLQSATENAFTLGSQEYRLYYNSELGTYLSGSSLLSGQYQPYSLRDGTPVENRNASGLGSLPYESDLGYLSFSMQLNDNAVGGDQVINSSSFTQVAEICFIMTAEAINNELVCFEANFAQTGVTDAYDSDLLNIEEWKSANEVISASPLAFNNIDASRGETACFTSCSELPQETGGLCGDGMDNDNDGLIDCADPGCSTFPACIDACNAIAPVLSATASTATQCDFVTGPVTITSTGGNNNAGYATQYALTDAHGDIILVQSTPAFEVSQEGLYSVYAINYKEDSGLSGLEADANIRDVTAGCFATSAAYTFTACKELDPCNYCLGETIEVEPVDINNSPGFTTQYVLTNKQGVILDIFDEPVVDSLDAGLYLLFALSYDTNEEITGLEIGENIIGLGGCCMEIGDSFVIGICDQLKPTIFFDLQGCDITQEAVLVVGGLYDSYLWSTGATQDFITVSATEAATYRVTVTLANGCIGIGSQDIVGNEVSRIGDFVWNDLTPNGRQDATDVGLNGVTINLYADFDRNGIPDIANFPSCTTVSSNHPTTGQPGYYEFTVYQSNYVIEFESPAGFVPADQNKGDDAGDSDIGSNGYTGTIAIGKDQIITNVDAGFRTSAAICGSVWEDVDSDGRRESGDNGMNNIVVNLYTSSGLLLRSTTTADTLGSPGFYCFEDIPVQAYYVEVELPDGGVLSPPNVGTNDALDSEGTNANGRNTTNTIVTNSGQTSSGIDFGYYTGGSICGIVFRDTIGGNDAVYDEGIDEVIANSLVAIIDEETKDTVSITSTGADGRYCATNIPVGSYQVCFGVSGDRNSYLQPSTGDDPLVDSDVNTTSGKTDVIFVSSGETINGINAGIRMDALPIELLSFTGRHDKFSKSNILDWVTAIEINNDRFEVERIINLDGNFEVVGTVDGTGTTNSPTSYQFTDKDATMPGNYYYRLRQIDFDGGFDYSQIIALKVGSEKSKTTGDKFMLFPNPASDKVQVLIESLEDNNAEFILTDIMGRVHKAWQNITLTKGDNLLQLDLESLSPGNYILQHNDGTIIRHERLQIIK